MTCPSVVRPAVIQDESEIWRLLRLMADENSLFPMSDTKVKWYLDRILKPEEIPAGDFGPRGMAGVIGDPNALEAIILLLIGTNWYSEMYSLEDCANFVSPEHRSSNHAKALIGYAKSIVDAVRENHPTFRLTLGIVSTKRTAAKIRLYERANLTPVGAYFMYPRPEAEDFLPLKNSFRTG